MNTTISNDCVNVWTSACAIHHKRSVHSTPLGTWHQSVMLSCVCGLPFCVCTLLTFASTLWESSKPTLDSENFIGRTLSFPHPSSEWLSHVIYCGLVLPYLHWMQSLFPAQRRIDYHCDFKHLFVFFSLSLLKSLPLRCPAALPAVEPCCSRHTGCEPVRQALLTANEGWCHCCRDQVPVCQC